MPESNRSAAITIRTLVLVLAVAWAGAGFLAEVGAALESFDARERRPVPPISWRPGIPQVRQLERCLAAARPTLPGRGPVAFTSPADAGGSQLFRWLWAAFLMPERDVIPLEDPQAAVLAGHVIAFRQDLDDPRFEPVRRLPGGRLYRIRR